MYDEPKAVAEIRGLSSDARLHLRHLWRNFLQVVSANAELGLSAEGLPLPTLKNLSRIRDAVRDHEKNLRVLSI